MNKTWKIGIVVALAVVISVTLAMKNRNGTGDEPHSVAVGPPAGTSPETLDDASTGDSQAATEVDSPAVTREKVAVPRLVDLGADKCIPCKQMAPILENLKKEYAGRMDVEFIDVWKNPRAGQLYGVRMIPTQIFFDAEGKELFRHQGFYSREDILGKWKELGIDVESEPASN